MNEEAMYAYSDTVLRSLMNAPAPAVITTGHTASNYSPYAGKVCRDIRTYTAKAIRNTLYDIDWSAFNGNGRWRVVSDTARRLREELGEMRIECDRLWHVHVPEMPNTRYGQFGNLGGTVSGLDEALYEAGIAEINRYNEISSLESRTAGARSCYSCAGGMVDKWLSAMAHRYPEFRLIQKAYSRH